MAIGRILAWIFAALAWLFVWRLLRRGSRPRAAPRFEGAMVRDRVCDTFLPRSSALTLRLDGEEHFFCSETCRRAFLSRGL